MALPFVAKADVVAQALDGDRNMQKETPAGHCRGGVTGYVF
jgi:hypothetical protein